MDKYKHIRLTKSQISISTVLIVLIMVVTSCKKDILPDVNSDKTTETNNKVANNTSRIGNDVFEKFKKARDEFYEGVPSAYDRENFEISKLLSEIPKPEIENGDSISWDPKIIETKDFIELDSKDYGIKENIEAYAYQASITGNSEPLFEYLSSVGLLGNYQKIFEAFGLADLIKYIKSIATTFPPSKFKSEEYKDGDIFLKYDVSSSGSSNGSSSGSNISGWLTPGKYGHAAYLDADKRQYQDNFYLQSASAETDANITTPVTVLGVQCGGRVGYDKVVGYWSEATEVAVSRVNYSYSSQRRAAVTSMTPYHGHEWGIFNKRSSNGDFYCSKVVYRGWLSQGIELEPHYFSGTNTPWMRVPKFSHWDYKWVWFVKVWYPVFHMVTIKDAWVTPTDLDDDSETIRIDTF